MQGAWRAGGLPRRCPLRQLASHAAPSRSGLRSARAAAEDLPPESRLFRPQYVEERRPCKLCGGQGSLACRQCQGRGRLPLGGYHAKNPHIKDDKLIDSPWTAMQRTLGWRHFFAKELQRAGKEKYVLMVSTVDRSVSLWVNARLLRDRGLWAKGWLQRSQLDALAAGGAPCRQCAGGRLPCPLCANRGRIVEL